MIYYYALIELQIVITIFFVVNTIFQAGYRLVLRLILRWFRKNGYNIKYILILGYNQSTNDFIDKVRNNSSLGYKIIGDVGSVEKSFYFDLEASIYADETRRILDELSEGNNNLIFLGSFLNVDLQVLLLVPLWQLDSLILLLCMLLL